MPLVFTESFCLSLFLLATVEHKFVSKLKKEEPDCGLCSTYFWCVVFINGPISNRFNGMCTLYTRHMKIKCI